MLPKHLSAIPKVGEIVWVFVLSKTKQNVDRIYIGPIISQLDKLNLDSGYPNALRPFSFAQLGAAKPVTSNKTNDTIIPELVGVFPNPEDISIQGRFNTDITQKNNEIVIRAGKFESANTNEFKIAFNAKTQAFIQIKNEVTISKPTDETVTKGTVTNIVDCIMQYNSDTASNYSYTRLQGTGAAAQSDATANSTNIRISYGNPSTSIPFMITNDIFSYAGSTYKTAFNNLVRRY